MYRPTGYSLISRSSVLNRVYNFTINRFEQVVTGLEALKQGLNVVNAPSQCQVPTKTKKPLYSVQEMNPGNEEWYLVLNRIVKWRDNLLNRISVWRPRRHAPLPIHPLRAPLSSWVTSGSALSRKILDYQLHLLLKELQAEICISAYASNQ